MHGGVTMAGRRNSSNIMKWSLIGGSDCRRHRDSAGAGPEEAGEARHHDFKEGSPGGERTDDDRVGRDRPADARQEDESQE